MTITSANLSPLKVSPQENVAHLCVSSYLDLTNEDVMIGFFCAIFAVIGYKLTDSFLVGFIAGVVGFFIGAFIDDASNEHWRKPIREAKKARREKLIKTLGSAERADKLLRDEQEQEWADKRVTQQYGTINEAIVCPHCQEKGFVRKTTATRVTKNRVNSVAGKAIGLGTNSEKMVTQLHCDNCDMTWDAS